VLPADEVQPWTDRPPSRRRRKRRYYPQPIFSLEGPEPPFFNFDRVLGLVLMGAGLLLVLILSLAGSVFAALMFGGLFLILGGARFVLPDFMTGTRFAGLIALQIGLFFVIMINASNRKIDETELGMVPFMFCYVAAVVFSALGLAGLLKG
jgi:hypothetical protein